MTFFERCEELAKNNNISLNELGRQVGVSGAAINGWRNGSFPKVDIAYKAAQVLGVTVEYLITGKSDVKYLQTEDVKELLDDYTQLSGETKSMVRTLARQLATFNKNNVPPTE